MELSTDSTLKQKFYTDALIIALAFKGLGSCLYLRKYHFPNLEIALLLYYFPLSSEVDEISRIDGVPLKSSLDSIPARLFSEYTATVSKPKVTMVTKIFSSI